MALLLHKLEVDYPKPTFTAFCIRASYLLCLIPWAIIRCARGKSIRQPALRGQLFSIGLSVASLFVMVTWVYSLQMTLVSLNNAVYQSQSSFVYIFSVMFLKLKVTLRQIIAVVLCVTGVCLISIFGSQPSDSPKHQSCQACGYLLCLASVIAYALYEVLYKRYLYLLAPAPITKAGNGDEVVPSDPPCDVPNADVQFNHGGDEFDSLIDVHNPDVKVNYGGDEQEAPVRRAREVCTMCVETTGESFLSLGLIGQYTVLLLWPVLIIVNYICWDAPDEGGNATVVSVNGSECLERFELPIEWHADDGWSALACGDHYCATLIAVDIIFDIAFNFFVLMGISLSSPLFMAVGCMLIIPIGIVVDYATTPGLVISPSAFVGCAFIIVGFFVLELLTFLRCCKAEHHYHRFWARLCKCCSCLLHDNREPLVRPKLTANKSLQRK